MKNIFHRYQQDLDLYPDVSIFDFPPNVLKFAPFSFLAPDGCRIEKQSRNADCELVLECLVTSAHSYVESILDLIGKKTLVDCLREPFSSQKGDKKLVDVYDVIKQMSYNLALSPDEYTCSEIQCDNLNSKFYHLLM